MLSIIVDLRDYDRDLLFHNGTLNGLLYAVRGGPQQGIYLTSQAATAIKMRDPTATIRTFIRAVDANRFLRGYGRSTAERVADAQFACALRAHVLKTGRMSRKTKQRCSQIIDAMEDELDQDNEPMLRSYPEPLDIKTLQARAQAMASASEQARRLQREQTRRARENEAEMEAYFSTLADYDSDEEVQMDAIEAAHRANALKRKVVSCPKDPAPHIGLSERSVSSPQLSSFASSSAAPPNRHRISSPSMVYIPRSASPQSYLSRSSSPRVASPEQHGREECEREIRPSSENPTDSDDVSGNFPLVERRRGVELVWLPPSIVNGYKPRGDRRLTFLEARRLQPMPVPTPDVPVSHIPVTMPRTTIRSRQRDLRPVVRSAAAMNAVTAKFNFGAPQVAVQYNERVLSLMKLYYKDKTCHSKTTAAPDEAEIRREPVLREEGEEILAPTIGYELDAGIPGPASDNIAPPGSLARNFAEFDAEEETPSDLEDDKIDEHWDDLWGAVDPTTGGVDKNGNDEIGRALTQAVGEVRHNATSSNRGVLGQPVVADATAPPSKTSASQSFALHSLIPTAGHEEWEVDFFLSDTLSVEEEIMLDAIDYFIDGY